MLGQSLIFFCIEDNNKTKKSTYFVMNQRTRQAKGIFSEKRN